MTQGIPGPQWGAHPSQNPVPYATPGYGVMPAGAGMPATDQRVNSAEVVIAWIFTVFSAGYFLPWAIAATRGKSNSAAIGLLNFFLGWTLIGWVIPLIMACGAHRPMMGGPAVWINHSAPQPLLSPYGYSSPQPAALPQVKQGQLPAAGSPYPTTAHDVDASGVWRP